MPGNPARDPATATWRDAYLKDYDALTTEVLGQRLQSMFGNWNFYIRVSYRMLLLH